MSNKTWQYTLQFPQTKRENTELEYCRLLSSIQVINCTSFACSQEGLNLPVFCIF